MSNPYLDPNSPLYRPPAEVKILGQSFPRTLGGAAKLLARCIHIQRYLSAGPYLREQIVKAMGYDELNLERILFNTLVYLFEFSTPEWRVIADRAGWSAAELDDLLLADWLAEEGTPGRVKIDEGVIFFWGPEGLN